MLLIIKKIVWLFDFVAFYYFLYPLVQKKRYATHSLLFYLFIINNNFIESIYFVLAYLVLREWFAKICNILFVLILIIIQPVAWIAQEELCCARAELIRVKLTVLTRQRK